jgi:hypothetical protein
MALQKIITTTGIAFAEPSDTYLEATVMIMSTFATGAIKVPPILPNFLCKSGAATVRLPGRSTPSFSELS